MFRLQRFLSLTSFVAIIVTVLTVSVAHYYVERQEQREVAHRETVTIARVIQSALAHLVTPILTYREFPDQTFGDLDWLRGELDRELAGYTRDTLVVKVKIYARDGEVVYSTETAEIGEYAEAEGHFKTALSGEVSMKQASGGGLLDQFMSAPNIIEAYVPIRPRDFREPIGVLELYADLSSLSVELRREITILAAVLLGAMSLLYIILLFAARRADRIIARQQFERGHHLEQLREAKENLEQRVQERTQDLEQTAGRLQESEERFRSIAASAPNAMLTMDPQGNIGLWNPAAEVLFGYSVEEAVGQSLHDLIVPERYREAFAKGHKVFLETGTGSVVGKTLELWALRRDGTEFPMTLSISALHMDGEWHATGIVRDISERKVAEAELRSQQTLLRSVLENTDNAFVAVDDDYRVIFYNQRYLDLLGHDREFLDTRPRYDEAIRQANAGGYSEERIERLVAERYRQLEAVDPEQIFQFTRPGGRMLEGYAARLAGIGAMLVFRDVTELKKREEQVSFMANHDALTGLPNRVLMRDRFEQSVLRAQKAGQTVGICVVDLDRFKRVNDDLGQHRGDRVLVTLGERIRARLREQDTVGRLGGDEFVVLLTELDGPAHAKESAEKISGAVTAAIDMDGTELHLTCSVGVALYPEHGDDVDALIQNAETAAVRVRDSGGGDLRIFDSSLDSNLSEHLVLRAELSHALERDELVLYYQPQVDLRNGRIIGAEALMRWQHPQRGLVPPGDFISLAEETGLIEAFGEWALHTACAQNKAWQDAGMPPLVVSVNVSARQLRQRHIVRATEAALERSGLEPQYLELELTESLIMEDADRAVGIMQEIRALGVSLSVDDFGTGYSSLSYLKRFPMNRIKIDRSFVRDITTDLNDAAIADTIIHMGHSLGFQVIAEGVETLEQLGFLRHRGCDEMQGYYFSPPIPVEKFDVLLADATPMEMGEEAQDRTLLLVDDEPAVLSALQRLLRLDGYHILTAGSGREGLDVLAKHEAGVVISDERMPEMTGTQFLSRVKDLHPHTIRIVLSGFADLDAVTQAINMGAIYKFFTKPWDDKILQQNVKEAFRIHELGSENERLTHRLQEIRDGSNLYWSEKISVGNEILDEQHRKLFEVFNRLNTFMYGSGDAAALGRIFDDLDKYISEHFATEEALMQRHGFPGYAEHKAEHERFRTRLESLVRKHRAGDISLTPVVTAFIHNWLHEHIGETDRGYVSFIADDDDTAVAIG
ncbi:MAG: hypothetical protein DRQ37_01445 [Gammaproteobacteria bacterium]|nr:MAG: hypothetical protein DRQ37_01445 [Gammaproteobacteria bacterium]